jgi:hypothetical protein
MEKAPRPSGRTRLTEWVVQSASFTRLLALLAVGLVLLPVLLDRPLASRSISVAISLTLVGLVARATSRRWLIAATLALAVVHEIGRLVDRPDMIAITAAGMISTCVFLGLTAGMISLTVWRMQEVTTDTVLGGVAVYLILGYVWGVAYSIVEFLAPGSFVFNIAAVAARAQAEPLSPALIYYSYVTLTTLGYGDIIPATSIASGLAAIEAVTGQLFIAVLIARVVGLYIAQRGDS